jgi:hypothetical protein
VNRRREISKISANSLPKHDYSRLPKGFFPYIIGTFKGGFVVHAIFTLEAIAMTWMVCTLLREPPSTTELET